MWQRRRVGDPVLTLGNADPGLFRRPFVEQIDVFRRRLHELRATAAWDNVAPGFHDHGFMVAGATKAELLADLARAVDRAIAEGRTLDQFRRDFRSIVERHGWHGWTGEGTAKGEAWRTRTIYRTNLATTYAAGRRAQLVAGGFRFWVYKHGGSLHPRLHHLSWDGVALAPDHPFWGTHSPPNGWGCSCYVVGAHSAAGVRRMGGDPDKALPEDWLRHDLRKGAPVGIDKGWAYAPGATLDGTVTALAERLPGLPAMLGAATFQRWPPAAHDTLGEQWRSFLEVARAGPSRGNRMIVGALKPEWIVESAHHGVPIQSAEIGIGDREILHFFRDAKVRPVDAAWFADLPRHLRAPDAAILERDSRGETKGLLLVFKLPPDAARLVLRLNFRDRRSQDVINMLVSGRMIGPAALGSMSGPQFHLIGGEL